MSKEKESERELKKELFAAKVNGVKEFASCIFENNIFNNYEEFHTYLCKNQGVFSMAIDMLYLLEFLSKYTFIETDGKLLAVPPSDDKFNVSFIPKSMFIDHLIHETTSKITYGSSRVFSSNMIRKVRLFEVTLDSNMETIHVTIPEYCNGMYTFI